MNRARVSIEPLPAAPDVIELVVVPPCTLAATAVAEGDAVRFVRLAATNMQNARTESSMTIVVADARSCVTIERPRLGARWSVVRPPGSRRESLHRRASTRRQSSERELRVDDLSLRSR